MNVFQAAILGIVQGLAEFLPISSSGHLELCQQLMGLSGESQALLLLSVLLHAGTLVAVVIVFWQDWWNILKNPFKSKTLLLLFIASLPALFVTLVLDVDQLFGSGFLGISFIITGIFLLLAEKLSSRGKHAKDSGDVDFKHALAMGGMQAIALMPGVSRSGSTLLGGVASGLSRQKAAKFSFMMSAPAIVGSLLVEGKDALENGTFEFFSVNALPIIVGVILAAVSGYLAIRYMLKLINRISFNWFAIYVFILGAVVIVLQILGIGNLPAISVPFLN